MASQSINAHLIFHHPVKQNGVLTDLTLYQQLNREFGQLKFLYPIIWQPLWNLKLSECIYDYEQPVNIINMKPPTQQFRFNHIPKAANRAKITNSTRSRKHNNFHFQVNTFTLKVTFSIIHIIPKPIKAIKFQHQMNQNVTNSKN